MPSRRRHPPHRTARVMPRAAVVSPPGPQVIPAAVPVGMGAGGPIPTAVIVPTYGEFAPPATVRSSTRREVIQVPAPPSRLIRTPPYLGLVYHLIRRPGLDW